MRTIVVTALLALATAACGGGGSSKGGGTTGTAPRADSGDPVAEIVRLKDEFCACDTRRCADEVGPKLNALSERAQRARITDDQAAQVQAASAEIERCTARITGAKEDARMSPPNM